MSAQPSGRGPGSGSGSGGSGEGPSGRRGPSIRGGATDVLAEILTKTKPDHIDDKKG